MANGPYSPRKDGSPELLIATYAVGDAPGTVHGIECEAGSTILLIMLQFELSFEYSASSVDPRFPLEDQVIVVCLPASICPFITPVTFTLVIVAAGPFDVIVNIPLVATFAISSDMRIIACVVATSGTCDQVKLVTPRVPLTTDQCAPPSEENS